MAAIGGTESSWSELVLRHREFLIKHVEPDFGLVDKLYANEVLSDEEKADIYGEYTVFRRNSKLLERILASETYDGFIEALLSSNQTHVVNYLGKDGIYSSGDDWPLFARERSILRTNHETLVELLDVKDLLSLLYNDGVISRRQNNFISNRAFYERNVSLLDVLSRRSIRDYKKTIRCLHASHQSHIAQILEEGGVVVGAHLEIPDDRTETEIIAHFVSVLGSRSAEQIRRILEETLNAVATKKDTGFSVNKSYQSQPNTVTPKLSAESVETQKRKTDTEKSTSVEKAEDSALDTDDTSAILKLVTDDNFMDKGSNGEVYGPINWRKQTYAVKKATITVSSITEEMRKNLGEKRDLWTSLSHVNLAGIRGVSLVERGARADLFIIMEFLKGGTLRKALDNNGPLPIDVVLDWAKQIGAAMSYLHERNIVHRDLKSNNVLLTESFNPSNVDEKITLKIADFDEMREHDGTVTMTFKGTLGWMAPEVLQTERFSKSSDVWSYGVVVWEMLTGEVPHKKSNVSELTDKAKSGKLALSLPARIPETFSQLLKYCFRLKNTDGASFGKVKEILLHE